MFISVDLPAPFSPTMPWIVPRGDLQVDVLVGVDRAEALVDADQLDRGRRSPAAPRAALASCAAASAIGRPALRAAETTGSSSSP